MMAGGQITKRILREKVREVVAVIDLEKATLREVRTQIEKELGVDLQGKHIKSVLKRAIHDAILEREAQATAPPPAAPSPSVKPEASSPLPAPSVKAEPPSPPPAAPAPSEPPSPPPAPAVEASSPPAASSSSRRKLEAPSRRVASACESDDSDDSESEEQLFSDDDEEVVESSRKRGRSRKSTPTSRPRKSTPSRPRKSGTGTGGLHRPMRLSADLADVLGTDMLPRTQVVKQLWAYFKEHDLQDPSDRRMINCDEKLRRVFGCRRISGFTMNKPLTNHLTAVSDAEVARWAAEHPDTQEGGRPKAKAPVRAKATVKATRAPSYTGIKRPLHLSEALAGLCGAVALPRTEVVKRIWAYVREHGLQNPHDGKEFRCDKVMRRVFGTAKVNGFKMNKDLSKHFTAMTDAEVREWVARREREESGAEAPRERKRARKRARTDDDDDDDDEKEEEESEEESEEDEE